jgi:hypothetical protein
MAINGLMALAGRAAEEPPRAPAPPAVFLETSIASTLAIRVEWSENR